MQHFGWALPVQAIKTGETTLGLEEAHRDLRISPAEFDDVAADRGLTLDFAKVPKREKSRKSWQPSPPTRMRSPPAMSLSTAEACVVSCLYEPALPKLGGDCWLSPTSIE